MIINSDTLFKSVSPDGSYNIVSYGHSYESTIFNGQNMAISVTGSTDFPAMNFSVDMPSQEVNITNPANLSTVNKTNDLIVTWTSDSDPNNKVGITVTGNGWGERYLIDDTGSHTITSSELSNLNAGELKLTLSYGQYDLQVIPNTNNLYAMALTHSTQSIYVNVQ